MEEQSTAADEQSPDWAPPTSRESLNVLLTARGGSVITAEYLLHQEKVLRSLFIELLNEPALLAPEKTFKQFFHLRKSL